MDEEKAQAESEFNDQTQKEDIASLMKEIIKIKHTFKVLYYFAPIFIAGLTFFGFKTWDDLTMNVNDRVKEEIEKKSDELAKEVLPRQLARSVASFRLGQAISEYLNPSKEYEKKEEYKYDKYRHSLMLDINHYIDTQKYSADEVHSNILDNQVALSGLVPFLADDLKRNGDFAEDAHIGFWIFYKFIENSTGEIRKHNIELFSDKNSALNIDILYDQCVKGIKDPRRVNDLIKAHELIKENIKSYKINNISRVD